MQALVTRITEVVTQFDEDGISVRFINADPMPAFDGLRSAADVNRMLSSISYDYDTQVRGTGRAEAANSAARFTFMFYMQVKDRPISLPTHPPTPRVCRSGLSSASSSFSPLWCRASKAAS
jgi:hypothetical protein